MYLPIQFEQKGKDSYEQITDEFCKEAGYQQRHWHIKSISRTRDCGVATFMVVGDEQNERIYKEFV